MTYAPAQHRTYFENRLGRKLPSRNQIDVKCPFHPDGTPSLSINLQDGVWMCHACDERGGILDFERKLTGKPVAECWPAINERSGAMHPITASPSRGESMPPTTTTTQTGSSHIKSFATRSRSVFVSAGPMGRTAGSGT